MHKFQRFCSWCRQECNRWCLTWWRSSNSEHGTSHMNCHSAAHRRDRYVCEIGKKHRNANCSTGERVKWTCVLVHSRNIILSCDKYRFMSVIIRMVEAKKNQNNINKERRKKMIKTNGEWLYRTTRASNHFKWTISCRRWVFLWTHVSSFKYALIGWIASAQHP